MSKTFFSRRTYYYIELIVPWKYFLEVDRQYLACQIVVRHTIADRHFEVSPRVIKDGISLIGVEKSGLYNVGLEQRGSILHQVTELV